jgi:uncharacterized membrane protein
VTGLKIGALLGVGLLFVLNAVFARRVGRVLWLIGFAGLARGSPNRAISQYRVASGIAAVLVVVIVGLSISSLTGAF